MNYNYKPVVYVCGQACPGMHWTSQEIHWKQKGKIMAKQL